MIKYTRGIRRVVGNQYDNPYVVDEDVIGQIQSRMEEGFIHIDPPDFNEGEHVVIQEGALKGLTGIFQKDLKARDRVMILLNAITYHASVEIERGLLTKA
jgi:transcription antitermination factor NusG